MKKSKILIYIILFLIIILIIFSFKKHFRNNENKITTSSTTTTISTTITTTINSSSTTKVYPNKLTGTSSKGYKIEYTDGAYYVDGYLIANKTYPLTSNWLPKNTHSKDFNDDKACQTCIDETAWKAWNEMKSDANAAGFNIWIQSGFRSYGLQEWLYNKYAKRDGYEKADKYSARAGHSEHQTGLAFDICSKDLPCISSGFNNTAPAKWLETNAYRYGYILRYPKGKENETGYMYESWHFRYVGKELAEKLYNDGAWLTMEDYFGITSKYSN